MFLKCLTSVCNDAYRTDVKGRHIGGMSPAVVCGLTSSFWPFSNIYIVSYFFDVYTVTLYDFFHVLNLTCNRAINFLCSVKYGDREEAVFQKTASEKLVWSLICHVFRNS